MKQKLIKIAAGSIIFTSMFLGFACNGSSTTANKTPTPSPTVKAPDTPRGCPSGTKACGDACIPDAQACGGE